MPEKCTETGDRPGRRYDSMGRRYPGDEYGHRIVTGSRRPKGIPPDVWKGLKRPTFCPKVTLMKDTQHPLRMALGRLLTTELRSWICLLTIQTPVHYVRSGMAPGYR